MIIVNNWSDTVRQVRVNDICRIKIVVTNITLPGIFDFPVSTVPL